MREHGCSRPRHRASGRHGVSYVQTPQQLAELNRRVFPHLHCGAGFHQAFNNNWAVSRAHRQPAYTAVNTALASTVKMSLSGTSWVSGRNTFCVAQAFGRRQRVSHRLEARGSSRNDTPAHGSVLAPAVAISLFGRTFPRGLSSSLEIISLIEPFTSVKRSSPHER